MQNKTVKKIFYTPGGIGIVISGFLSIIGIIAYFIERPVDQFTYYVSASVLLITIIIDTVVIFLLSKSYQITSSEIIIYQYFGLKKDHIQLADIKDLEFIDTSPLSNESFPPERMKVKIILKNKPSKTYPFSWRDELEKFIIIVQEKIKKQ